MISEEGVGSEFVLTIPVDRQHYHAKDFLQASNERSAMNSSPYEILNGGTQKVDEVNINEELPLILIAEDNRDMRSFIRDTLKAKL